MIEDSSPNIYNNIIFGGKVPSTVGVAGIRFDGSGGRILNNTIDGGLGGYVSCIDLVNDQLTGSDPDIINNILFVSDGDPADTHYCINEWNTGAPG